jgi:hypothetical protein
MAAKRAVRPRMRETRAVPPCPADLTGPQPACGENLFPSRMGGGRKPITTRHYARLMDGWVGTIGLDPALHGTHSLRRTQVALIYLRTGNLRAVQLLLGHTKIERAHRPLPRRRGGRRPRHLRAGRHLSGGAAGGRHQPPAKRTAPWSSSRWYRNARASAFTGAGPAGVDTAASPLLRNGASSTSRPCPASQARPGRHSRRQGQLAEARRTTPMGGYRDEPSGALPRARSMIRRAAK